MQIEYINTNQKPSNLWLLKIIAKIILSRIPMMYQIWQRLGLFRHGKMDNAEYAIETFMFHIKNCNFYNKQNGLTILEIGPGDSVASALIAKSINSKCILIDTGNFLSNNLNDYKNLAEKLVKLGFSPPDLSHAECIQDILNVCDAQYYTDGLKSLKNLDSDSIDMIFSQAVLEHVRLDIFDETIAELRRVLKSNGTSSHEIDLKDHLGFSLNNLRFSKNLWESNLFSNSGFYTNRLRYSEIINIFKKNNFKVNIIRQKKWNELP